jgi:hypothetical protein
MEKINELLEKYFRAETSVVEENELKNYFSGSNIADEHEVYVPLFKVFIIEQQQKLNVESLKRILPKQQSTKRLWIKSFIYSGMAATILLFLWVQRPVTTENYAIVSGNKIENSEYAQQYAEKKLDKVNQILKNTMEPMQSMQTVKRSLRPMKKMNETREQLNEIQYKIQFK